MRLVMCGVLVFCFTQCLQGEKNKPQFVSNPPVHFFLSVCSSVTKIQTRQKMTGQQFISLVPFDLEIVHTDQP